MDNISDCKDTTLFPNSQIFIIIFSKKVNSRKSTVGLIRQVGRVKRIELTIIPTKKDNKKKETQNIASLPL